jgi:peptidoglycan/LPS O-acetylase OafA/YrhL
MIGRVRFVLATLVVMNHIYLPTANRMGAHAVAAFYIVSGFLMTKIIQEVYGTTAEGCGRFLLNRLLRIYPPYWCFLALTLLGLTIFPATFGQTYPNMQLPRTAFDYFRNVTLYELPTAPEIVIPAAWTLTVEMGFYLLLPLALGRARSIAVAWWIISLAITGWLIATEPRFGPRYTPMHAASIFFATGSMLYFFRASLSRLAVRSSTAWGLFLLFCVLPLLTDWARLPQGYTDFYGAALIFVPVAITALQQRSGAIDRWFGDLAYPVFIAHLFAAGLLRTALPSAVQPMSLTYLVLAYAICIGISIAFVTASRQWLEPVRSSVRTPRLDAATVAGAV